MCYVNVFMIATQFQSSVAYCINVLLQFPKHAFLCDTL